KKNRPNDMMHDLAGIASISNADFPKGIAECDLSYTAKRQYRRGVAQPGSALAWGARGRRFESFRSDQHIQGLARNWQVLFCYFMPAALVAARWRRCGRSCHHQIQTYRARLHPNRAPAACATSHWRDDAGCAPSLRGCPGIARSLLLTFPQPT